jgi:hypothetical protein
VEYGQAGDAAQEDGGSGEEPVGRHMLTRSLEGGFNQVRLVR